MEVIEVNRRQQIARWKMIKFCLLLDGRDFFFSDLQLDLAQSLRFANVGSLLSAITRYRNKGRYIKHIRNGYHYAHAHHRWKDAFLFGDAGFVPGMFAGELNEPIEILEIALEFRDNEIFERYFNLLYEGTTCYAKNTLLGHANGRISQLYKDEFSDQLTELAEFFKMATACGIVASAGPNPHGLLGQVWEVDKDRLKQVAQLVQLPLKSYLPAK
jgi:hypothetical protein